MADYYWIKDLKIVGKRTDSVSYLFDIGHRYVMV